MTGVFGRRRFLQASAASIVAATLASCSSSGGGGGGDTTASSIATTTVPLGWPPEIVVAQTALSFELLGITAYDNILASGLVTSEVPRAALDVFRGHHLEHGEVFRVAAESLGVEPVSTPNPYLLALFQALRTQVETEQAALALLRDIEVLLAQRDVVALPDAGDPAFRSRLAVIACVEHSHQAHLSTVLSADAFPTGGAVALEEPAPGAVLLGE